MTLDGYRAFAPDALPPPAERFVWTSALTSALAEASVLLGRLSNAGKSLPNPYVLMRVFARREAVASSHIEGTQATLGELLASEAGAVVERSPDDVREVANYVAALEHGLARLGELPLSLRLVRELHEKLLAGVRGDIATPGEFRRTQNWIGRSGCTLAEASFVPPPPDALGEHLRLWELFLHDTTEAPLVQAAWMHYQFETLHPFLDGNGRVGRLLIVLLLCVRKTLPAPLLYLSAFFERTRDEYYARLRAVSENSDWAGWLAYFLRGVSLQAADALQRAELIATQLRTWQNECAVTGGRFAAQLAEHFAANPFAKIATLAKRTGASFNTVSRALAFLCERGLVEQLGDNRRDRVFCARKLLQIMEAPAQK